MTDNTNGNGRAVPPFSSSFGSINAPSPHVLIVAAHEKTRVELERSFPDGIATRSVAAAAETEGLGAEVVVVGGEFPLADLLEVRAHPRLHDKPVVLFAPCKDVPALDWESNRVWPVLTEHNALGQLIEHVRRLFSTARSEITAPESVA